MNVSGKKIISLLLAVLLLSFGSVRTADAIVADYTKGTWILKEGQSKVMTVKGMKHVMWSEYYGEDEPFSYEILSSSKVRITALRGGSSSLLLTDGSRRSIYSIIVMPKKSKDLKTKTTGKGTKVTYKKVTLTLPKVWKNSNYVCLTGKDHISFHSKLNYKGAHGGHIFTIHWCSAKKWKQYQGNLPNFKYIGKKGKTVYYMTRPTDVQFYYVLPKYRKQYMKLDNTVETIFKTIKIK